MIVFCFAYSPNFIIYFRNLIFKNTLCFQYFYNNLLNFVSFTFSLEPSIILFSFLTIMNNFIFKDKSLQWRVNLSCPSAMCSVISLLASAAFQREI